MSTSKHDFTATEIKAGFLVLASFVILVIFFAAIRGCTTASVSKIRYYAEFSDISGLNQGADVRFGGVKVGRVVAIRPDPDDRTLIRVTAEVRADTPVNRGSVASIEQVTLTTAKHLEISTGGSDQELLEDGDILATGPSAGLFDVPDLEGMVSRLERVLEDIVGLLGVQEAARSHAAGGPEPVDVTRLLTSLDATVKRGDAVMGGLAGVIEDNRAGFQQIVERLVELERTTTELMERLSALVEENQQPLTNTVKNLETLTAETNRHLEELTASLKATLQHLEDVGGNTSDLLEVGRPTLEEILINLQEATRNLSEFSRTLSEQPQALIRGRKVQGRKNGEETR